MRAKEHFLYCSSLFGTKQFRRAFIIRSPLFTYPLVLFLSRILASTKLNENEEKCPCFGVILLKQNYEIWHMLATDSFSLVF